MASSSSWRRFLRVSLRGLIVLVVVIGLWLGWLARCGADPARGRSNDWPD